MENQEKNDPIWELLEHASEAKPSPFFARNVVREVHLEESPSERLGESLLSFFTKRFLNTAIAAAAMVTVIAFFPSGETDSPSQPLAQEVPTDIESTEFDPAMELDEVEYLGQLVAINDPGQLTDEALADLFF